MKSAKNNLQLIDTGSEVSNREKTFLIHGAKKIPIHADYASKYSLFFRYTDNQKFTYSDEQVNLLFQNNGQRIELGPCRILPNGDRNGYAGRLVFLHDAYDVKRLLKNKKVVNLRSKFDCLPVIFARKEKIRPSFKEYTGDLAYDLCVYKKIFDDLDSQCYDEPEDIRRSIQKAIIDTEGKKFKRFLDKKLEELKHVVADFSTEEYKHHGFFFRKQLWHFILCCPILARTNLKPRGYPGDSEMMRMVYLNDYQGDSTFAKLFHKHVVEHPAAQSVRNRIKLIAKLLDSVNTEAGFSPRMNVQVLSVGCGPAFELQDVMMSPNDCKKYNFTLLDQDSLAHSEAAALVNNIEKRFDCKINVDYLECSVRTMLFSRKLKQNLGQFDFIYSMGLFDYLAAPVAKAVLKNLYQILKPGGKMVIGNFHVSNPSKYYMDYWCDWVLLHRTEEEFIDLSKGCDATDVSVLFEDTGSQMFLNIKKPLDT
jgi:extracellular factor (EF) 3-hydroxypalmitic acid methyl ester biosynthesis protein